MANRDIAELRAEVKRRQKAANDKISRLRANGIELSDTEHDPRRDLARTRYYGRQRLESYLGELNAFTDRKNRFYPMADGTFATAAQWAEYKRAERNNNRRATRRLERLKDTKIPGLGVSPWDLDKTLAPARKGMRNIGANKVVRTVKRSPKNINGPEALAKLIADFERRANPETRKQLLRQSRNNASSLLDAMGAEDLKERVAKLDDARFRILVEDTGFMEDAAQHYSGILESDNDAITDGLSENKYADLLETIEWAETLTDQEAGLKAKRRR